MKKSRGEKHRIFAVFLCFCVLFMMPGIQNVFPVVAAGKDEKFQKENIITAFDPLSEDIKEQTVFVGTDLDELDLPKELTVYLVWESSEQKTETEGEQENTEKTDDIEENSDEAENVIPVQTLESTQTEKQEETVTIVGVTWQPEPEYDGSVEEIYTFTAILPEGYALADGVSLPEITITVERSKDAMIQALRDRIAALPEVEEYLATEPNVEDEDAYAEWEEKLYEYAGEAITIWEEYEALTEEQQAQISEEELAKLAAWVELAEMLSDSAVMLADDSEHHAGWTALPEGTTTLSTQDDEVKYYYLPDNMKMDTITVDGNVTLCLNGHTLEHDGSTDGSVIVVNSGTFTLCDCMEDYSYEKSNDSDGNPVYTFESSGGCITGGNSEQGGGVCIRQNATFNMESGVIRDNKVGGSDGNGGGGVYLESGNSKFNMSGGAIAENSGYEATVYIGGNGSIFKMSGNALIIRNSAQLNAGVRCNEGGVFEMLGGEILGNITDRYGCVLVEGDSTFYMKGGLIEGNISHSGGVIGAGVHLATGGSRAELSGGKIINNISYTTSAMGTGGIKLMGNSTNAQLLLSGDIEIRGNYCYDDTTKTRTEHNIYVFRDNSIKITGPLSNHIGLTSQEKPDIDSPVTVANGDSYSIKDTDWYCITSDEEYKVTYKVIEGTGNQILLEKPGNCDLSGLDLTAEGAKLEPNFQADITTYTATVGNEVDTVDITATLATTASGAKIIIKINDGAAADMENGVPKPVGLNEGKNTIVITVTSGELSKTYTIEITREASEVPTDYNVNLNGNGGAGTPLTSYTYGTGATLPIDWKKTGYDFAGWYEDEDCTGTAVTEIPATATGDKEYWAKWTDNIAPVIGTLTYNYQPKNFWHWLIGKDSLIIMVPVTEEGSGADEITYTVTPDGGTAKVETAAIQNGEAEITVSADFKGTISIACTDKANNTSTGVTVGASLSANGIIIEDNAPEIAFQAENAELLPAGEYRTAPDIAVTISDDKDNAISGGIASVSYKIGNGSEKTVAHDYTTSMVVNDSFTIPASEIPANGAVISVTATDNAGNSVTQNYTVKVHTHSGTLVPAVAPTCTTAGNREYYTCTCGKWFSDSGCVNEITDKSSVTESARGHDFSGEYLFDTAGHWKKCSRCAETTSREEHHFETDGTQCTVCDYEKEGQGHTHSATLVPAKPATCTEDGHEAYYTCSCGKWFSDSGCVNEITDHASVITVKLGHDFSGQYLFDENGHWKVCFRCSMAQTSENHVFDDDNDTTCNKCGYQRTIGTHTHSVERTAAATEPTCTTAGNRAYYICSCGKWFSDSACTKEVTAQDVTIPQNGHTAVTDPAKAATCTETGLTEGSHCSVCGHVIKAQTVTAALGHDYSGNYHYDANGHWKVCSRCGTASAKHGHRYNSDRDAYCIDCGYKREIGNSDTGGGDDSDDEQPAPTPTPEPPLPPQPTDTPQPTPQPSSPTNPPGQPQPTEKPNDKPGTVPGTPDNSQPEDKQEPASIDNGKSVISGEPVATGNVEGMTDTSTVLELGNGAVIVTVVCAEQEYTAGVADNIAVANAVLTPEQMELVNNGDTIEIRIDVKDISGQVPEQDKEVIENGIEEYRKEAPGLVLGMYVDISMSIRIGEGDWSAITATKEPVEIIIGIPETLQEKGRSYVIIRAHDGVHTLMDDMDDDPGTITVSTDLFSSYAIAYVQAEGTGHKCGLCHICPTFLGICYFVWLAIIILIMIVVIIVLRKKKEKQEAQDTRQ